MPEYLYVVEDGPDGPELRQIEIIKEGPQHIFIDLRVEAFGFHTRLPLEYVQHMRSPRLAWEHFRDYEAKRQREALKEAAIARHHWWHADRELDKLAIQGE